MACLGSFVVTESFVIVKFLILTKWAKTNLGYIGYFFSFLNIKIKI